MKHDKVIERVKKLLAMSKDSSSPHEAAIAANRARKLIDKYQIDEMDLTSVDASDMGTAEVDMKRKRASKPMGILGVAVANLNDCLATYEYDDLGYQFIQFKGMLVDSVTAAEMLKYLRDEMDRLASWHATGRADSHAYRLGFASGVAAQVREILAERKETVRTSDGTSLMVLKDQLVKQHFGVVKYKSTRSKYSGSSDTYSAGYTAGKNVNLSRQVQKTGGGYID